MALHKGLDHQGHHPEFAHTVPAGEEDQPESWTAWAKWPAVGGIVAGLVLLWLGAR